MSFLDKIIQYDKELLVFINTMGSENWDGFWLAITNQLSWIPLYLLFFYLIFKALGWKKGLGLILLTALLVTFSDQFTVFLKNYFERLRPNRDPSINEIIRILKNNSSFSFVSGHATTSTAVTLMMHLTLKKYYKYTLKELDFLKKIIMKTKYIFQIICMILKTLLRVLYSIIQYTF